MRGNRKIYVTKHNEWWSRFKNLWHFIFFVFSLFSNIIFDYSSMLCTGLLEAEKIDILHFVMNTYWQLCILLHFWEQYLNWTKWLSKGWTDLGVWGWARQKKRAEWRTERAAVEMRNTSLNTCTQTPEQILMKTSVLLSAWLPPLS